LKHQPVFSVKDNNDGTVTLTVTIKSEVKADDLKVESTETEFKLFTGK